MPRKQRTTKKDTPIVTVPPHRDPANADDATIPWTPAWVAAHMAHNDARYVRVKNEDNCCGGLRCMHYQTTARRKVRGKGAPKPTGVAVSLDDGTLTVKGLLKALGRYN